MDIGIIGYGIVGKALYSGFSQNTVVHIYDPLYSAKEAEMFCGSIAEVYQRSKFIFVCVPTPQIVSQDSNYGNFDASIIDDCMAALAHKPDKHKIIALVSTVIPPKVESYLKNYPALNIVVSPELLTERTAEQDFLNPKCRIIGGKSEHATALQALYEEYSTCQPCKVAYCSAVTAAYIKYVANAFFATKVSIMNQFYDLYQKMDRPESWEEVAEILLLDPRLGHSHCQVPGPDGDRGWGGKCFPKDTSALCHYAESKDISMTILRAAIDYNETIRKNRDW